MTHRPILIPMNMLTFKNEEKMKKPFTDLTDVLTDENHRLSEKKQILLKKVFDAIGAENVSGVKGRGRDKLTVYTFGPVSKMPAIRKVRWKQDFYFQEDQS